MTMKKCKVCNETKPIDGFYRHRNACKECLKAKSRKRYRESERLEKTGQIACPKCEQILPSSQFYKSSSWCRGCHKTRLRSERVKEKRRYYKRKDPIAYLLYAARHRAKRDGLEFSISREDIVIPSHCPALGLPLSLADGKAGPCSPSIDRIDSSRGYVPGNVAVISTRANKLKNDATWEELQSVASWLLIQNRKNG